MSADFADFLISAMILPLPRMMTYSGLKPLAMSTPILDFGKSMTWPTDALTVKPAPKYFLIVLALAGDSTTTSAFVRLPPPPPSSSPSSSSSSSVSSPVSSVTSSTASSDFADFLGARAAFLALAGALAEGAFFLIAVFAICPLGKSYRSRR